MAGMDLNLEEFELEMEDLAEVENEVVKGNTPKKSKKEKQPKEVDTRFIGANEVALTMLETDGPKFRAWLRRTYPDRQKGSAWRWERGSKELQEVIDGFNAYRAGIENKKNDPSIKKEVKEVTPEILEEVGIDLIDFE